MGIRSFAAGPARVWVLTALCWAAAMALAADWMAARPNTLALNGQWRVGKLRLDPPTMGAQRFLTEPQTLEGSRLNLGAWHGYQEVVHRNLVDPAAIEFDFRLGRDTYLLVLFEHNLEASRQALRISNAPDRPAAWLRVEPGGRFESVAPLPPWEAARDRWHRARLVFLEGEARLSIDGAPVAQWPAAIETPCRVGFRSGPRDIAVDRVRVWDADGRLRLREDFTPGREYGRGHLVLLLAGLVLPWAAHRVLRRVSGNRQAAAGWLLAMHLWVLAGAATLILVAPRVIGARYPAAGGLQAREHALIDQATADTTAKMMADFARDKGDREIRVLFVGTSQTEGSGAGWRDNSFVALLERRLADDAPADWTVRTMRGAVSGSDSTRLTPVFLDTWITLDPDLVVVNLACNDKDMEALQANIGRIAEGCASKGCRVLLVQEAMSAEQDRAVRDGQHVMGAAAQRFGLPVVDADGAMAALGDAGLMWWDIVHPTDFGHAMLAGILWPPIRTLVEEIAAERAAAP